MEVRFDNFILNLGQKDVLNIPSFKIDSGSKIGIFGANGSGKSTLADLLFKLHLPTSGSLKLDGANILDLGIESLRSKVSLIREAEIFHGTIEDNLKLGNEGFSRRQVRDSLDAVGLGDELDLLTDGLETELHPWGAPLSRGQVHRLIIARAILRLPRLLIIDGLLDSIDDEELERAFKTLLNPSAPWSLIVFTHEMHVMEHFNNKFILKDAQLKKLV